MPVKQVVNTGRAPKTPPNVLNQAIISKGMVYCSGQLPIDPSNGELVEGDIAAHTVRQNAKRTFVTVPWLTIYATQHQALRNLTSVLEAAGTTAENVVKVNIFVADIADVPKLNEAYEQYFGSVKPCRSLVTPLQFKPSHRRYSKLTASCQVRRSPTITTWDGH